MTLELRVLRGARAGQREQFAKPLIAIGRNPLCDFRFDPQTDLDVSSRHAEIEVVDGAYVLRDAQSTNGTFVAGARLTDDRVLRDGDVVTFGPHGPQLVVRLLAPPPALPGTDETPVNATSPAMRGARLAGAGAARRTESTTGRITAAVRAQAQRWRRWTLAGLAVIGAGVGGAYWLGSRGTAARDAELAVLRHVNDSLTTVYTDRVATLSGRVAGLDSALAATRLESDRLQAALSHAGRGAAATSLAGQLSANEQKRQALLSAAVSYEAIAKRNGAAVTLVAVEWADGRSFSGSGFCVDAAGLIVTNRHLVADSLGRAPRRIAVIFSDTRDWLSAHVVRSSSDADLTVLRIDGAGSYPVIGGLASAARVPVGSQAAIIGFPLGIDIVMEGSGTKITARSSLVAAVVSKHLADVLQLDAYAGEGSSGSPVFNLDGRVIGVVYGGPREANGRIVYAVPADRLPPLLRVP